MNAIAAGGFAQDRNGLDPKGARAARVDGHRPTPVFTPLPKPNIFYEFDFRGKLVEVRHG